MAPSPVTPTTNPNFLNPSTNAYLWIGCDLAITLKFLINPLKLSISSSLIDSFLTGISGIDCPFCFASSFFASASACVLPLVFSRLQIWLPLALLSSFFSFQGCFGMESWNRSMLRRILSPIWLRNWKQQKNGTRFYAVRHHWCVCLCWFSLMSLKWKILPGIGFLLLSCLSLSLCFSFLGKLQEAAWSKNTTAWLQGLKRKNNHSTPIFILPINLRIGVRKAKSKS